MKIFFIVFAMLLLSVPAISQTVITDPAIPVADQPVTITVDVTGTSLDGYAWDNTTDPVWIWTWVAEGCASNCDAPTNVDPATDAQNAAKMTRISTNPDKYDITFTPTVFFNRSAEELKKIGIKLKTRAWDDDIQTDNDRFITLSAGGFIVNFSEPSVFPLFKSIGEEISITANASASASLTLKINGDIVQEESGVTTLNYTHTVAEPAGPVEVIIEGDNGTDDHTASFQYIVRSATIDQARPPGIVDGINYSSDHTKATLSLWAPGKSSVYALGDFTDWEINPSYQMKKDGEHFWIELTGLTAGEEYAFQYLVDESIYIADPYADKILDPDDQYIPEETYPDLKVFPAKALKEQWYFNRLAVLQTGQQPYAWQITDFEKPGKEKLVIYELLVRDFFSSDERNYQNLIDTLGYFKRLGINAIEFMPVMEFNGNESWGYNPTFMFAPDKYYGTKNKLKEFIDKCHENGIAVILDIVMNHQDIPNPYALMDYDFSANKPQADNKWFNVNPTHPFNVFFDMNHESTYTKKYLDTVNYYWLNEFKADGYRFDLSKGFTQTNHPDDVGAWSDYDASRIALLKRMADKIWANFPDAYVILEHLSVNDEEKELAEYRADEGKGMMLWGKMTEQYNQNTMGYAEHSDIAGVYHTSRGWTVPHLVSYMESHDEERLMYRNAQSGRNVSGHNTKTVPVALKRMQAAATAFYTIPGPKMLWQFGELGYDFSINHCPDGSNNSNCRVSPKPVKWEYRDDEARYALYEHVSDLNRLRNTFDVFTEGTAAFSSGEELVKHITLANNPYTVAPADADEMNVVIAVNFDVNKRDVDITFPHDGSWYDYYSGSQEIQITGLAGSFNLKPAEYKLFTDYPIESPFVTGVEEVLGKNEHEVIVYPNPVKNTLHIKHDGFTASDLCLYTNQGRKIILQQTGEKNTWDVSMLPKGFYVVRVRVKNKIFRGKFVKE